MRIYLHLVYETASFLDLISVLYLGARLWGLIMQLNISGAASLLDLISTFAFPHTFHHCLKLYLAQLLLHARCSSTSLA